MNERGYPSADEPTHLNPYWRCGRRASAWKVEHRRTLCLLVIQLCPRTLRLPKFVPGFREQTQHSSLLLRQQAPRAAQDWVARSGVRMVQAQQEKEGRVLAGNELVTVAFEGGKVSRTDPQRVHC